MMKREIPASTNELLRLEGSPIGSTREPFYRSFGECVRGLRVSRGLTQEAVGAFLRPPQTRASVSNIESGNQRVGLLTAVQLAELFGCQLSDLVPARRKRGV